jgi:DNA-binding transcriptional LysR family regulator
MDIRQIRYFIALYEEGSITRAAERLHVVQPAVSTQIRKLEAGHGITLFQRTPRGMVANETAAALYRIAVRVTADLEEVERYLAECGGRVTGKVAIGVAPSVALGVFPEALLDCQSRYPDISIVVREGYTANLVQWLNEGSIDLGILTPTGQESGLAITLLASEHLLLVASPDVTPRLPARIAARAMADLRLVLPSGNNLVRALLDETLQTCDIALHPAMEVDSLATVFGLLDRGGWATVLPEQCARERARRDGYQLARIIEPAVRRDLVLASLARRSLTLAGTCCHDVLANVLRAGDAPQTRARGAQASPGSPA